MCIYTSLIVTIKLIGIWNIYNIYIYIYIYIYIICISYNTGKNALPDIYARCPRGECVYIRQSTLACVITNMLLFQHYKICPNLKSTTQLAYIVTNTDSDCGRYF